MACCKLLANRAFKLAIPGQQRRQHPTRPDSRGDRTSRLGDMPGAPTAIIIEPARSAKLAELIVLAYGFTARERQVTRLVVLGHSTTDMAQTLHLSPFTVQDYLKNIFDKVGVRTRRELVATVFHDHYWPRVLASETAGAEGFFYTAHSTPGATSAPDR